jgi:hypothetical protein
MIFRGSGNIRTYTPSCDAPSRFTTSCFRKVGVDFNLKIYWRSKSYVNSHKWSLHGHKDLVNGRIRSRSRHMTNWHAPIKNQSQLNKQGVCITQSQWRKIRKEGNTHLGSTEPSSASWNHSTWQSSNRGSCPSSSNSQNRLYSHPKFKKLNWEHSTSELPARRMANISWTACQTKAQAR